MIFRGDNYPDTGGGVEVAIQLGTEGKITDWKAVGVAGAVGAVGAVTGGLGGRLATQALKVYDIGNKSNRDYCCSWWRCKWCWGGNLKCN